MRSEKLENSTRSEVLGVLKETEQKLLEATRYLGHPAYGLSSSITFHVDDLREELFDFLGIHRE